MTIDRGLTVQNFLNYIQENSINYVTEDLKKRMLKWEEYLQKAMMKSITIVQTESREIDEAMKKDPDLQESILHDLENTLEIDPASAKRVKKRITKITERLV